jgi:hypothetical protein
MRVVQPLSFFTGDGLRRPRRDLPRVGKLRRDGAGCPASPEPDGASGHSVDDEPEADGEGDRRHDKGRMRPPEGAAGTSGGDLIHERGGRHLRPNAFPKAARPGRSRPRGCGRRQRCLTTNIRRRCPHQKMPTRRSGCRLSASCESPIDRCRASQPVIGGDIGDGRQSHRHRMLRGATL